MSDDKKFHNSVGNLPIIYQEFIVSLLRTLRSGKRVPQKFFGEFVFKYLCQLTGMELANLLGESWQNIHNWTSQGAPKNWDGTYSISAFLLWFRGWLLKDVKDYDAERTRKTKAEASLAELKLAEETGRLVDRPTAYRGVGEQITTAKGMIEGLPQRLALLIPDEGRAAFIKEAEVEVADLLRNLTGV